MSTIELFQGHRFNRNRLLDVAKLEKLRSKLVEKLARARGSHLRAYHEFSDHSRVMHALNDVLLPTAKCNELFERLRLTGLRFKRYKAWVDLADIAIVEAINIIMHDDKRRGNPHFDSVINFVINGREYVMKKPAVERRNDDIRFEKLVFPNESGTTAYSRVDLAVTSPRKNTIRTGRAYKPEEILPLIGRTVIIDGDKISVSGKKLRTFHKKGVTCVRCGLVGTKFYKEKELATAKLWSMNLYAVGAHGNEIMMTRDHIIPVAKNGNDKLENSQTMCIHCNNKKGDSLETTAEWKTKGSNPGQGIHEATVEKAPDI